MDAIQAVGFDLGETLLFYDDTPLSWASLYEVALSAVAIACRVAPSPTQIASACEVLRQYNTRLVPREEEVSSNVILARVLAEWDAPPSATVLSAATESFFGFFQQRMRAYSDTLCALRALGARSLPLGLLTDVPYGMPATFVRRDLRAAGIAEFFSAVLTSGDVGRRKPAAAGFVALAEQLGVAPEGLLFIGNEAKDVIGARRAGARAVFLDHTDSGVDHGQEFTICRLSDALPLLDLPSA